MPAFVFVSGYLSKNVDKARQTAFTTFFLPFLLFNILWNGIAAIVTWDLDKFSFITPGWALWYLMSMFLWKISLKDLVRIKYIVPISFIVGLGAGIFGEFNGILSLSRTLVFFPFFVFVLANTMTAKNTFFSKIGRNTLPIYILHTYLLCIPIAINYFIPSMWVRLFICLVSATGITYVLSRNTTERYFRKFLASALALFLKNESR